MIFGCNDKLLRMLLCLDSYFDINATSIGNLRALMPILTTRRFFIREKERKDKKKANHNLNVGKIMRAT
jgi:hypothetical protein